jgi:hypothetical protein
MLLHFIFKSKMQWELEAPIWAPGTFPSPGRCNEAASAIRRDRILSSFSSVVSLRLEKKKKKTRGLTAASCSAENDLVTRLVWDWDIASRQSIKPERVNFLGSESASVGSMASNSVSVSMSE